MTANARPENVSAFIEGDRRLHRGARSSRLEQRATTSLQRHRREDARTTSRRDGLPSKGVGARLHEVTRSADAVGLLR